MADFSIQIEGQEAMEKAFQEAPAMTSQELNRAMRDSLAWLEEDTKRGTPVDTGRLRARWATKIRGVGPSMVGELGNRVKYAAAVEHGARPHMPPVNALRTWARRHGIDPWALAMAISLGGTKGHHMMEQAFDENQGPIQKRFEKARDRVIQRLGED